MQAKATALILALQKGYAQAARILLEHGARVDVRTQVGGARGTCVCVCSCVCALRQGADGAGGAQTGETPLVLAERAKLRGIARMIEERATPRAGAPN